MKTFFQFIKTPRYNENFLWISWKDFFSLIAFYFFVVIQIGGLLFLVSLFLKVEHKSIVQTLNEKIVYGIVLAPIVEELLFRILLVFNKKNLLIFLAVDISLVVLFIAKASYIKFSIFIFLIPFLVFAYYKHKSIKSFLIAHYEIYFYSLAILFAMLHMFNFNGITLNNWPVATLLVIPQIVLGTILGYIRVQYGIIYSILFHALVNISILLS